MRPLSEAEIRASFINCSKGEASRIKMPADLSETRWQDLDFFAWTDPAAPLRTLLVVPDGDQLTGIVLRRPDSRRTAGLARSAMCQVCHTGHSSDGVTLFVAPLAGPAGRQGNTIGEYICSDLACSLYMRGKRQPRGRLIRHEETLSVDERVERAMTHLIAFTRRVAEGSTSARR